MNYFKNNTEKLIWKLYWESPKKNLLYDKI